MESTFFGFVPVLLVGLYHLGTTPALAYIWEIKVMSNGLISLLVLKLSSCLAVVNSVIGAILPRRVDEPIFGAYIRYFLL